MDNGFSEYLDQQYLIGYDEGEAGGDYTGRTFIGYYGWCEGHEAYLLRRRNDRERERILQSESVV